MVNPDNLMHAIDTISSSFKVKENVAIKIRTHYNITIKY